jgi:seryl-tRNA synthetase
LKLSGKQLKLRYRDENKRTQLLHTLNGSALALPVFWQPF